MKAELLSSKDLEKNLTRDIAKLGEEVGALEADKHTPTNKVHRLENKNADLSQRVMTLTNSRVQEVKAAVREAKARLMSAYAKVLSNIKEKWVAKKDHSLHEGHAAEVESNLMLIDQIQKETVDLEVEKPRLAAQLVELNAKCA